MSKLHLIPVIVAVSLALVVAIVPASAANVETSSTVVTPEVAEALKELSVRAKLVDKLGHDALRISVTVAGNRATLTGEVPKKATQELAREVALSVKGIQEVDNQVTEAIPAGAVLDAKSELKDAGLEIKVKTLLLEEIGSNAINISVESTDGVVSLRGKLSSEAISKAASERVKKIHGVKSVVNLLTV